MSFPITYIKQIVVRRYRSALARGGPARRVERKADSSLIALLLCMGTVLSPVALGQRAEPIPVELVLQARSFAPFSSIEWSPDGKWLAYVVKSKQRTGPSAKDGSLQPWAEGEDVWLMNSGTMKTRILTSGTGESWLPRWSPGGRYLAFVSKRDHDNGPRLWVWDAEKDTLQETSNVVVTTDQIEWMPDGRRVLVTVKGRPSSSLDGNGMPLQRDGRTLAVHNVLGPTVILYHSRPRQRVGEPIQSSDPWDLEQSVRDLVSIDIVTGGVLVLIRGRRMGTFRISPDGARVAYTVPQHFEKPGSQQILYDLAVRTTTTHEEVVVASDIRLDYEGGQFSWSPDGKLLSFHTGGPNEKAKDCYVVSAAGGIPENITGFKPQEQASHSRSSVPLWDKRGTQISFVESGALWCGSVTGHRALEVARIPGRDIVALLHARTPGLAWILDHASPVIVLVHDNTGKQDGFYRITLKDGSSTKLLERNECYTCASAERAFAVTEDGRRVAYLAEDAQNDTDLWLSDVDFREPRRVTHLNPQFDGYKMGAARLIEWLGDDGQRLQGALLLPSDYVQDKRYPLVVWVYGGGFLSNWLNKFGLGGGGPFNFQLLATRGYAVLLPDSPRQEGTPMVDLAKTVLPGVNEVIRLDVADPDRIGILGQSNGGYSTLALLVQTRRFKAAIEVDGMADLIGLYGEMDQSGAAYGSALEHGFDALGGSPWEFRERYIENSPLFYLDRIDTPLLIVHGGEDSTVAPFLGDQVFVALRRLGKEAVYAKYKGEGHSPLDWSHANQLDLFDRMVAWFDRYLNSAHR